MKKQQRFTPEFRAEAVKLVTEQGLSQKEAAKRLVIPKGALANWMAATKAFTRSSAPGARSAVDLEAENARLRKELTEARMERDIKRRRRTLPGSRCRYAFMKQWRLHFPVTTMSRLFSVSRSGFYTWLRRKPSRRAQENERLKVAIKAAHKRTRESYSARRLQPELAAMNSSPGATVLPVYAGSWGCVVGRSTSSRRLRTRTITYQSLNDTQSSTGITDLIINDRKNSLKLVHLPPWKVHQLILRYRDVYS